MPRGHRQSCAHNLSAKGQVYCRAHYTEKMLLKSQSGADLLVPLNSYYKYHRIKDNVIRPAHLGRGDKVVKVTQFQCSTEGRHLLTNTEVYFAKSALTLAPPIPYQLRLPDVIHDCSPTPYLAVNL